MSVSKKIEGLTREAARYPKEYAAGRGRRRALGPYEGPAEVVAALRSQSLSGEERNAIVVALVREAQESGAGKPWQVMLLAAYAPLIARLQGCVAMGEREDFEQEAVIALLEEIDRVQPGAYAARSLQLALRRRLAEWCDRAARGLEVESYDEELHGVAAAPACGVERALAVVVSRICESERVPELAEALLSAPSLVAYVARAWPDATPRQRK